MSSKVSPCKGCEAPKRHPMCHAKCQEYIDWAAERQQQINELREAKRREQATNPRIAWKARSKRRNSNGNY